MITSALLGGCLLIWNLRRRDLVAQYIVLHWGKSKKERRRSRDLLFLYIEASALRVGSIKAPRGNRHYRPAHLFPQVPHPSPTSIHLQPIGNGGAIWPQTGPSLISLISLLAHFASFPNSESPATQGASHTFYADNGAASTSILPFHCFS